MSKLLIYPKRKGNTFTVCDYISKHAHIDLKFTNEQEQVHLDHYTTIILCSGVYMGKPHINLIKWLDHIEENQKVDHIKFYMLMTWFGRGQSDRTVINKINDHLKRIGAKLEDNYATCFGQGLGFVRIGHPDRADLEKIQTWVNDL